MKLSSKVLVIGGGPAGSTAAGLLASRGTEVMLLEKNPAFAKPCGGGISLSALRETGTSATVVKREVKTIRLISPGGKEIEIDISGSSLAIVERGDFDRTIRNQAKEHGSQVLEGEFLGMHNRGRLYEVEARIAGDRHTITAEYVVAADGVNSRVRTALGIAPVRSIITASVRVSALQAESCEFWFGSSHAPRFYSWVFPATKGISVGTGTHARGTILSLFETFTKRTGIRVSEQKRVYRIPVWSGDLYNRGNVLFAGDAAGQVLPLTYEGLYYAMKSGELAAASIGEGKVRNYKKRWKERFEKRFALMDRLRKYFLKDDASVEKLIDLHGRQDVQEASLQLWLRKDSQRESLVSYMKFFGKLLR